MTTDLFLMFLVVVMIIHLAVTLALSRGQDKIELLCADFMKKIVGSNKRLNMIEHHLIVSEDLLEQAEPEKRKVTTARELLKRIRKSKQSENERN